MLKAQYLKNFVLVQFVVLSESADQRIERSVFVLDNKIRDIRKAEFYQWFYTAAIIAKENLHLVTTGI